MSNLKTKPCIVCGTEFIRYKSTDKCCSFSCYNTHNSQKKKSVSIKNDKKPYVGINDLLVKTEVDLFSRIWEDRPHKSFLSNKPLNFQEKSGLWYNLFAHVLAKGKAKYPRFKLYSKNIVLLTPQEHTLLDQSSKDQRDKYALQNGCNWNKIYDLEEELKGHYKRLFP